MSKGFVFWLLMLLWLLFGLWGVYDTWNGRFSPALGGTLLEFILFGLLGWQVFGKPIE